MQYIHFVQFYSTLSDLLNLPYDRENYKARLEGDLVSLLIISRNNTLKGSLLCDTEMGHHVICVYVTLFFLLKLY